MPWLTALVPILASAQQAPGNAVVDHRLQPPFPSLQACLEFARGAGPPPAPAARLICGELERVWRDPATAKPAADNPLRIDFGAPRLDSGREPAQGAVDGALLARILTVPDLLPPRLDAGLVLENLIVTGTLELTDASIDLPVVLRRATFRPTGTITVTDHLAPVAIRLERARFADVLEIRQSDIAGHVLIDDSAFAHGLTLADVVISSRADLGNPTAAGHLGRSATLQVRHSTFEAALSLSNVAIFSPSVRMDWGWEAGSSAAFDDVIVSPRSEILRLYSEGDFRIERSELGTVSLRGFQFAGPFILRNNRVMRMEIANGDFESKVYIDRNRVLESATIDGVGLRPHYAGLPPPNFAANQIGGSFRWAPSVVNANVDRIDLTYNRIDGLASIFPPDGSHAEIDLSNVKISSKLELGHSYWGLDECGRRALYNPAAVADESCPAKEDRAERLINLTNASIDILSWNFPLNSSVRWDGVGLRYAYWGDPYLKSTADRTDEDFIKSLKSWRFAMQEENSEALAFMSSYLESRGEFIDSRDLQEDAKKLDYRPESLTDPRAWVIGSLTLPTGFGFDPKLALVWLFVGPQTLTVLGDWVVYLLLWPTGFGVKPELALFWLFVGWLFFGALYAFYQRSQRADWPPAGASRAGLQEAPASYAASALDTTEQPSLVPGFMQYQRDRRPADFSIWAFSADAQLPVINLHAYTEYYPRNRVMRFLTFVQHIIGWWMLSIFLASATIL